MNFSYGLSFFLLLTFFITAFCNVIAETGMHLEEDGSRGIDLGYGVCVDDDVIYVVGSASYYMYIAGFSISNGSKLFSWLSEWMGELYDCIFINSSLFVVGVKKFDDVSRWFVGVFDRELNLLRWRESYDRAAALSLVYSQDNLYIAGYRKVSLVDGFDDIGWVIEKVDINNISNYVYVVSNPSIFSDIASAISVNPVDGSIWVVGSNGSKRTWRIEIYTTMLELITRKDFDVYNYPYTINFDSNGNAYIAGYSTIIKINNRLEIIARTDIGGKITKAIFYNNSYYVVINQHSDESGILRNYVYMLDNNLNILYKLCATCGKNYSVYIDRGKIVLSDNQLYAAGYSDVINIDRYNVNTFIVLYSIILPRTLLEITNSKSTIVSTFNVLIITIIAIIIGIIIYVTIKYLMRSKTVNLNRKKFIRRRNKNSKRM